MKINCIALAMKAYDITWTYQYFFSCLNQTIISLFSANLHNQGILLNTTNQLVLMLNQVLTNYTVFVNKK